MAAVGPCLPVGKAPQTTHRSLPLDFQENSMTSDRSASRQPARHRRMWPEISTWLAQTWQRWAQAQRNRHAVDVLSELDEHQLKDIGMTRGDIESVVAARSLQGLAPPRAPHQSRLAPAHETPAA
ncbi:MAG: DUF1127 domain-containing protein, partial [Rhizobacter sp.]